MSRMYWRHRLRLFLSFFSDFVYISLFSSIILSLPLSLSLCLSPCPRGSLRLNMKMNHFHHRAEGIWWVHLSPPGTATQISPVTPVLFSHRDVFVLWASPWSSLRCWQDMLGPCVLKYSVRKWLRLSCPWVRKEDEEAGYLQPVRSSRAKMVNHWLSSHRRQRSPSYSIIWALHCVALQLWNVRVLLAVMMSTFFSKP